jgi:hypothetical protein
MSLTLKVKRGYTCVAGVPIDYAALNAGFLPIITLEGTIGSTDIGPGVINKTHVRPDAYWYAVDADVTGNVIAATYTPATLALVDGLILAVKVKGANTGAVTFNPDGLGAKPLLKYKDQALAAGDLKDGMIIEMRYDTDQAAWQLLTPVADAIDANSPQITGASSLRPHFLALVDQVTVYSGTVAGWATYAGSSALLTGKSAAILQVKVEWNTNNDGNVIVNGRAAAGGPELIIGRAGAVDATATASQAIIPVTADGKFDFEAVLNSGAAAPTIEIKLVGYYG